MHATFFDAPLTKFVMKPLAGLFLSFTGWRVRGSLAGIDKCVIIAAPHTSNWDLVYTLLAALVLDVRIYWMGKHSLFRPPAGRIMAWLGGIPINRSRSSNVVRQSIEQFRRNQKFMLAIPPSGTRSRVRTWKTGFYFIAKGAGVPVALGFLDYRKKEVGIGPLLYPSGDFERDTRIIRGFYSTITGKFPEKSMFIG